MIKNFDEILEEVKGFGKPVNIAVAAAEDKHTLEACLEAEESGLTNPIFIGDEEQIKKHLQELKVDPKKYEIIQARSAEESAKISVELAREDKVGSIMKGMLDTKVLLKAVVNKEKGIRTDRLMTHLAFNDVPSYHKLLVTTDGGMVTYPELKSKVQILENAVEVLNALGYEKPKVACIAAVEKVNENMPETVDAFKMKEMNEKGEIEKCVVEGPISFDLTYDKKSCELKNYNSPVGGDADIIVFPNFVVGNILGKSLVYAAKGKMAGFIAGAKVPIILTSRSSSKYEKYLSIALTALVSNKMK